MENLGSKADLGPSDLDLDELDDFVINNMKNCKTELLTKEKKTRRVC